MTKIAILFAMLVLTACRGGGDEPDAGEPDRGARDQGPGQLDAAPLDAGPLDAAPLDAARPDAARPDAARPDAARPDATPADAAPPDAAPPDADPADPADLGCPAYADAGAPEPAIAAADLRRGSPAEQGCRLDRLFVDAPAEGPSPGPAFGDGLARRLSRLEPGWFCAAGDGGCLAEVGADIEQGRFAHAAPLIPPGTPHAGDAPERFHRLSFRRPVRPEALPDVVGAVRRWADEAVAGQLTFLVGRECVAIALGTEPRATPALREAVVRRIGLAPTPPGDAVGQAAEVALVDTGLEAVVADELGADAVPLPGGDLAGPLHPHGTAMGLLVRQVTPRARLHDVRVLGTPGHGDIGDVARGIIAALGIADMDRRRALVLNLSLGWPPELGQRRVLRDAAGDAAGFEDPVGESVRFALLLAAREEGPGRPIVVVAAAGNRPGRPEANRLVYNSFFDVEPGATPATRCPGGAPGGPYLFFPAAWSQVPTCAEGDDPRWLATAIGGLSDADAPATLAILGAEPPLVAPAEHAYVASARAPASLDTFQCDAPPDVAGFTSPTALTGTSVAAALTSGVVVRLIAARRDAGLAVPDAARLLVLATAAGRRLERGVHALDACRADAAVACAPAACVDADLGAGLPAAVDACAAALAACPALDACPPPPAPPPLPDGFTFPTDEACLCHRAPGTPTRAADCATADTLCPYEVEPDIHSRGAAGPQPEHPSCPECTVMVELPAKKGSLYLALEKKLSGDAQFLAAWVVFTHSGGKSWRPLADTTPLASWAAGQAVLIEGLGLDDAVQLGCAAFCTADLVTILQAPTGTAQVSVPLRVKRL
ncbi:MAG: S8/S53 family peptidase [bacterium]